MNSPSYYIIQIHVKLIDVNQFIKGKEFYEHHCKGMRGIDGGEVIVTDAIRCMYVDGNHVLAIYNTQGLKTKLVCQVGGEPL